MSGSETSSKLRAMKWQVMLFLVLSLGVSGPASAQKADPASVREAVQAGKARPLAEILTRVQAEHGGKVLDVDLERDRSNQQWYEITLLTRDGQRTTIHVDAVTGQDIPNPRQRPPHMLSMAEVVRRLQATQTGAIREIELEDSKGGRRVYKISLRLPDGREQRLQVDAYTGQTTRGDLRLDVRNTPVALPELIESIERRLGGQARELEAKVTPQGRLYYELELQLPNGRGLDISVDALSGQVLREEDLD
jgi:uncharacterized membrane protein YkoI